MLDEYNKAYQKGDIKAAEKIVSDYYAKTGKARPETGAGSKTAIAKAFAEKNTKPATPAGTPGGTPHLQR
jgi:hypothetical protein